MKSSRRTLVLWTVIGMACAAVAAEPDESGEVAITLHDSHGLSAASVKEQPLEIILFKPHTGISLKISNRTKRELTLWRPYCPQGDDAMRLEFRHTVAPLKVFQARTNYGYTGGMGIPKVFALAAGDDLLVKVDLLNEWGPPFDLKTDEVREMEVRAVYRSEPMTEDKEKHVFWSKEFVQVWRGVASCPWQKVRILNRTGAAIQKGR